jgi:hypothetical protein
MGNRLSFVLGHVKQLSVISDAEANNSQNQNAEVISSQNQNSEVGRSQSQNAEAISSQNTEAISSQHTEPWPNAIECHLQQPNSTDPRLQNL